jgi:uncharacterized membrane protein YphA (DoxX/SURF4 family)
MALPLWSSASYELGNWEMMLGWLQFKGLPIPAFLLGAAILTEFVGGLLLIVGFRVRYSASHRTRWRRLVGGEHGEDKQRLLTQ